MTDFLDAGEAFEIGVQAVIAEPGSKITESAARRSGTDINIILQSAAQMVDAASRKSGLAVKGAFLDSSEGEQLDRLCAEAPFFIERQAASPAVVYLSGARPTAAQGAGTVLKGHRFSSSDGVVFQTIAETTVAAADFIVSFTVQAVLTGIEGNVGPNTVTKDLDGLWDSTFVWSHAEPGAGGNLREGDDELKARYRKTAQDSRVGTLRAIEAGAVTVPGITRAVATNLVDTQGRLTHYVTLTISDDQGNANQSLVDLAELAMDEFAPAGIPVEVFGGEELLVEIEIEATFFAGFDPTSRWSDLQDRVVAEVNAGGPGETLKIITIGTAAKGFGGSSTGVDEVIIHSPPGNLKPGSNQVIRTSKPLIKKWSGV